MFSKRQSGFGLVETIVAMGIFMVFVIGGAAFLVPSLRMNRLSGAMTDATLYAQEGIEAALSIKYQGWTTPFLSTDCSSGCGVTTGSGYWAWSGTSNTKPPYTRVITITSGNRDGSGSIVASGGIPDPNTKKVTSTVTWNAATARPQSVVLSTYFTYWSSSLVTPTPTPLTPTPTPTLTPTPLTPTPTPASCNGYCLMTVGRAGVCAKSNQCNAPKQFMGVGSYGCSAPNGCCCQ